MVFQTAGPAEIVRLAQKDEYFLARLRSEITSLIQKIKGIRWWMKWHKELDLISDLSYFVLTTCLGNQTLGEEYVNVIQVDNTITKVPSSWRRSAMIMLHLGGPYFADRWSRRMLIQLSSYPDFLSQYPSVRNTLQNTLPHLNSLVAILHRCHLVIFYFQVKYYHLAKRLTGTRYVLIRPWLEDSASRWGYWFLGILSLIQLGFSAALYLHSYWSSKGTFTSKYVTTLRSNEDEQNKSHGSQRSLKCPLCLDTLLAPTTTPCGHVFCWNCIIHSLDMKHCCPLCSHIFEPSRLVCLQNYN